MSLVLGLDTGLAVIPCAVRGLFGRENHPFVLFFFVCCFCPNFFGFIGCMVDLFAGYGKCRETSLEYPLANSILFLDGQFEPWERTRVRHASCSRKTGFWHE